MAAFAGGFVALASVALLDPQGQLTHIDAIAAAIGVLAGMGLDRLLRA